MTNIVDHLLPNLIIVENKDDYKMTRNDTLAFMRIVQVKKMEFNKVTGFAYDILREIKTESVNQPASNAGGYSIKIVYDKLKSDSFFLPEKTCKKFFAYFEGKIKAARISPTLLLEVKASSSECQ